MLNKIFKNIVLCFLLVKIGTGQRVPKSTCPRVFRYLHDGNQWIGVIRLPSNTRDTVFRLNVNMALTAELPSQYVGALELFGDRRETFRRIASGTSIGFKIIFPIQEVLPVITSILLNGNEYCRGDPPVGMRVTTISLFYILYTEPANPTYVQQDSVIDDPNFANDDQVTPSEPQTQNFRPANQFTGFGTHPVPPRPSRFPDRRPPQNYNEDEQIQQTSDYECGVPKMITNALIVGGDTTNRGEWPWLVAMFMKKVASLQFICSGSLISHNHIITAGHCVVQSRKKLSKDDLIVKLGSHNIQDWADEVVKTMELQELFVHPEFDHESLLKNDIAILKVSRVEFNDYIIPVCLWRENNDLSAIVGQSGSVVGWGRDENGLIATPEPRLAKVPIVSTSTCRASREEFFRLTSDSTICAGRRDGTGPCNGDSGGGLFLKRNGKWTLRGIVSNSLKDADTNSCDLKEYVIYTDSAKFSNWINDIISS